MTRIALFLIRLATPAADREWVLGDTIEEFDHIERSRGPRCAGRWLRREMWRVVVQSPRHRFAVRRRMGVTLVARGDGMTSALWQDVRYALRVLKRSPGFTAIAVATLALGIGANTAMFAVVNGVLLKPLPFKDPDSLMLLQLLRPDDTGGPGAALGMVWSYPKYRTFLDMETLFDETALFAAREISVTHVDEPERVRGEVITEDYPAVLGIAPVVGRPFTREEAHVAGTAPVAMIGEGFWARRFGRDPAIVGSTLHINTIPYTVIGVLPRGFRGLSGLAEIWVPLASYEPGSLDQGYSHAYSLVARRKADIAEEVVMSAVRAIGARIDAEYRDRSPGPAWGASAQSMASSRVDIDVRRTALMLLAAVGFVLLIACVNLTTLLAAKALGRRREVAIRLALGAGRLRVARQFIVEALVLAGGGVAAGVLVAAALLTAGAAMLPDADIFFQRSTAASPALRGPAEGLTRVGAAMIALDFGTLFFASAVAVACAGLMAFMPALQASSSKPIEAIKSHAGRAFGVRGRTPLVVTQIALTLVVLAGAGLMLKSIWHLQSTAGAGVQTADLLAVRLQLPNNAYTPERANAFFAQLTDRVRGINSVQSAGLANCAPISGGCGGTSISFGGPRIGANTGRELPVGTYFVSPDYLRTLGISLIRGRNFTADDRAGRPRVVLVDEAAARAFWPGADPIGQIVALGTGDFRQGAEVVGIVSDVRYGAIEASVEPGVYIPLLQSPRAALHVFVRSRVDTRTLVAAIRQEVRALDPNLPLADVRTMEERLSNSTWRPRVSAWLLTAFSAVAVLLTAVGIFGVMAQTVSHRTAEFAIRMAIGAQRRDVLAPLLRHTAIVTGTGIALGIACALALARLVTSLLYGVPAHDPATFITVATMLGIVALVAGYIPARRATRVNAVEALRAE